VVEDVERPIPHAVDAVARIGTLTP
jgi:hypothetical protein